MIDIQIKTDGKKVLDYYNEDKPTLKEVSLVIYRMEQMKLNLLSKEFKSEFEVRKINKSKKNKNCSNTKRISINVCR